MLFKIHQDAQRDILALRSLDPSGIGKILSLLTQIKADPDLVDRLNLQGEVIDFPGEGKVDLLKISCLRKLGDIWRLKAWTVFEKSVPYRVIYAYFPVGQFRKIPEFYVLAVVDRSKYNYELSHPITQRVLSGYNDLL